MKNKICVYAITKNESKFVDKWVSSMSEADEIVVLDTGSTDNTVELFKKYDNVKIYTKEINPWRFDIARNEAMNLIPDDCNILVSTDLDEILEPGWADILKESWIEGKHERATYKYSWSHLENGDDGRVFAYDKIHSRNWIWKYPVHELLVNTKTGSNKYDYENVLNLFDYIHLHHYPDLSKSRGSYLKLLELRREENHDDYYGLIYLSHEYYYQKMYDKSIELLKYIIENFSSKCNTIELASCYLFLGDNYKCIKDYNNSIISYMESISIDNTYREPYLNLSKVYMDMGHYSMAKSLLIECLKTTFRHFTWLERDTSWTYEIWDLLSLASYYNGDKLDSLAYATKAYSLCKTNERLKNNIDIILNKTTDKELIK